MGMKLIHGCRFVVLMSRVVLAQLLREQWGRRAWMCSEPWGRGTEGCGYGYGAVGWGWIGDLRCLFQPTSAIP